MIATLLNGLARAERFITTVAFLAMAGVMFADVVFRELGGSGIIWARQTSVYLNIVVVMIGMGIASSRADHLRPRFADHWLPESWEPVIRRIQHFLMAAFCVALAAVAVVVVRETFALNETASVIRIPVWPVQAIMPTAFAIAAFRHLLYALFPAHCPVKADIIAAEKEAEAS